MSDIFERLREAARGGNVFVSTGQAADEIEKLQARIAELEAALLNLIEHTLDCEIELNKLHGLGNGAGAGTSSALCEAHAALEGGKS